jgi:antitoxin MazE
MQVAKWGNSLAVRLPKALVDELGLTPGDEVEILSAEDGKIVIAKEDARARALEQIRALQRPLPADYKFDRDEANSR